MAKNKIIIEDKELEDIYKLFFKYKSIKYKSTQFIYNGESELIKEITNILNIKSRRKRLEYIFDSLCAEVDANFSGKELCGYECNQCIVQRKGKTEEVNGCCKVCRFQSENGCKSSNLTCKLFFCDEIKKQHAVIKLEDMKLTNLLTLRQKIILKFVLFSSREEVIIDLFWGSVILAAAREFYMLIKTSFFLIFNRKIEKKKYFARKFLVFMMFIMSIYCIILQPALIIFFVIVGILDDLLIKLIYKK